MAFSDEMGGGGLKKWLLMWWNVLLAMSVLLIEVQF
jgi:hypothetical protein